MWFSKQVYPFSQSPSTELNTSPELFTLCLNSVTLSVKHELLSRVPWVCAEKNVEVGMGDSGGALYKALGVNCFLSFQWMLGQSKNTTWQQVIQSHKCGLQTRMEKEMATHSSTLAWKIPWMGEPGRLHTVHGVAKSQTLPSNFTFFLSIVPFGEGNGNPLQCSCLENPMDGGPGGPQSMGLQSQTRLSNSHTHTHTQTRKLYKIWISFCLYRHLNSTSNNQSLCCTENFILIIIEPTHILSNK